MAWASERPGASKLTRFQILNTKSVTANMMNITKTRLYNFDPLEPHFHIVKLGFTGVYNIFVISAQKHRLRVLVRTASNEYLQHIFLLRNKKILRKHAYLNILRILTPLICVTKNENFQMKNTNIFLISAQNIDLRTRYNRLEEAVLTSTHNLCF